MNSSLAIDIPSANYQPAKKNLNLWVKLAYRGQNAAGDHLWGLAEYGSNEQSSNEQNNNGSSGNNVQDNNGPYDFTEYMIFPLGSKWNYKAYNADGRPSDNVNVDYSITVKGPVKLSGGVTAYSYYQGDTSLGNVSDFNSLDTDNFYYHGQQVFVSGPNTHEMPVGIYQIIPPVTIPRSIKVGDHFTNTGTLTIPSVGSVNGVWEANILEHLNHYSLAGNDYNDCLKTELILTAAIGSSHEVRWSCRGVGMVEWLDVTNGDHDELQSYSIAK